MNSPLSAFGNVPVSTAALASLYPHIKGGNQKIRQLEREGQIIRLKRGLYVNAMETAGRVLSAELIANHLYGPSYVSMSSALSYYGLIPEAVYAQQSMTLKHAKVFDTPLGRFEYIYISREAFSVGLTIVRQTDYAFVMASPEKALCDLVANSSGVNLRYIKEAEAYITEDIRMEMADFKAMDAEILKAYIRVGKKAESIRTLLRLMQR
ncbi:MAG: hypothetical protein K2F84_05435 [Bacteroidales bacterium]|nr:hypothetical protein [Bacteroidales bacterium]